MATTNNGYLVKCTAASDEVTGQFRVTTVRWVGGTTAGHTCEITDSDDKVVFSSTADGANFIDIHPLFRQMNGIKVATLDSGTIYLYYT